MSPYAYWRERERERETETDRQTDRQTERSAIRMYQREGIAML